MHADQAVSDRALAFLRAQRLPPTPPNYVVAFAYAGGAHAELSKAIDCGIDGGVRLTQADMASIHERFFWRPVAPVAQVGPRPHDALRHQTLALADLAATASATAGRFTETLALQLADVGGIDEATLRDVLIETLARSSAAERELSATNAEVGRLREKLEAVEGDSQRDALTGLANRRGYEAYIETLAFDDLCIAICDIDRFKSYNDRYGHSVGDRVLKTVAQSLQDSLAGHFVSRWGGEEFLVIARGSVDYVAVLLDQARDDLGNRDFKLRENDEPLGRISFSAGVAAAPDRAAVAASIEWADALLYHAKRSGRDRVCTAIDDTIAA